MSVSQKQTLEIVKVLFRGADILILDEPTALLTPQETEKLFAVMRNMKADGKAVVIITPVSYTQLYLLDSVQASTMLSNSEFIVMLNQAASDRDQLAKLLSISNEHFR